MLLEKNMTDHKNSMSKMSFCINANKSDWVDRNYAHKHFFDASF